jgi:hypothetical protein
MAIDDGSTAGARHDATLGRRNIALEAPEAAAIRQRWDIRSYR